VYDEDSILAHRIVWEDGTEEYITDMPDWVATRVDEFLTELEEEMMIEVRLDLGAKTFACLVLEDIFRSVIQ
jgi:hypothetical protein